MEEEKERLEFVSLADLYQELDRSKDEVNNILRTFKCDKNPDIEQFLHNTALEFELRDRSRSYLWLIPKGSQLIVAGYFTLAVEVVEIEHLPKSKQKKLNKGYNPDKPCIPAYLLGQIGRSDLVAKEILNGETEMMPKVFSLLKEVKERVGLKLIIADIIDGDKDENENLVEWYKKFGFKELDLISSNGRRLLRLYLILKQDR